MNTRLMLCFGLALVLIAGVLFWMYWPGFTGIRGAEAVEIAREAPFLMPDTAPWREFLAAVVTEEGLVDYEEAGRMRPLLATYLEEVARATPARFAGDNERLAFYINAYNALVIEGVLRHAPMASVEEAGPFHKFFRERAYLIAGARVSLHGLETKVIRRYNPLLHFGLNCASRSCPPLGGTPFEAATLVDQLERAAAEFIANETFNTFDPETGTWRLSKIFQWYEKDFGGPEAVAALIGKYHPAGFPPGAAVEFREYDWRLNRGSVAASQP